MSKPIDIFILNQQSATRTNLSKAFDMGWDACEERIIKVLENLAELTTNHQHKLGILEAVSCIKLNKLFREAE